MKGMNRVTDFYVVLRFLGFRLEPLTQVLSSITYRAKDVGIGISVRGLGLGV